LLSHSHVTWPVPTDKILFPLHPIARCHLCSASLSTSQVAAHPATSADSSRQRGCWCQAFSPLCRCYYPVVPGVYGLRRRKDGSLVIDVFEDGRGVQFSGAADAGATVTWPGAEVAVRLSPFQDCSFVFQSFDYGTEFSRLNYFVCHCRELTSQCYTALC